MTCADCGEVATMRCAACARDVCAEHLAGDRFAALQLFGPRLVDRGERLCRLCYRERLWRAWRVLGLLVTVLVGVLGAAEGSPLALAGALPAAAFWTWLSTRELRLIARSRAERHNAGQ